MFTEIRTLFNSKHHKLQNQASHTTIGNKAGKEDVKMKQIEGNEGSTVLCEEVRVSTEKSGSISQHEEKIENVLEIESQDSLPNITNSDTTTNGDSPSEKESESLKIETITEVKKPKATRTKPGENGTIPERKFALRPRKSEPSEESTKPRKKSLIAKKPEEKTTPEPPVLDCANDNSIKFEGTENMLPPVLPVEKIALLAEPESEAKLNELTIKPIKETSESSTSDNSNSSKAMKRKRRRRKEKWMRKKRRKEMKLKGEEGLMMDSESSRNTSPSLSDNFKGKRKNSDSSDNLKKNREFVVSSPSLADINVKAAIPESTATSVEMSSPSLCLCRKKPQVFVSVNINTGDLYCQSLDCIDNRIVGCCNPIPSQDVGMFRASEKAPYQMMCGVHQQRLLRHNCCPGCGLFCTQGKYFMCKNMHHFHKLCCMENENNTVACPHCGDETPPKSVVISIQSPKDPVFLPQQRPPRTQKSAKMSITRSTMPVVEQDGIPVFTLPTSVFISATGEQISATGLPQSLNRDKLAHLLNIACRSFSAFSKVYSSNRYTYKSLYNAANSGDVEKLLRMIASGLNPNYVFEDSAKQTPLHVAAASGHLPAVHILLQAQAQINVFDAEQNTPLTAAINAKHNDVVKYLIKCGANLILKSEDGMSPLHIAAKSGNVGACFHILNGPNLPPKYIDGLDDGGWTPMVWAAEFNHLDVVKFLLSKRADPLIKDAEQNIALHWAAFGGSIDIVELYLNEGSDINAVNVHGDTPLHIAARQDKYSCVLLLLARGAKSDIKNKNGELPRDCAESPESDIYKGITLNMEISALLTRFQDRTPKVLSNDISRGKERNQIQCVNGVDDEKEPNDYIYVTDSCFTSKISVDRTITSLQSCKCNDNCNALSCNCASISIQCWYDSDGRLKPDFNYTDPPMIFECNQACQCNRITCHNRVVQNGISCRFQLFRTNGKGWGIKTLNLIPKGTYVCEYIGEIISDCEADHREDDSYLFDLDNRDGETYCIDARRYGNFARFINHMCVPNLMPVHVFVDHQDIRFPRIAFFANRDILPDEELGYNYGEKFWVIKWKSFTCNCGAEKCIYSETTIKTTLDNYNKKLQEENNP